MIAPEATGTWLITSTSQGSPSSDRVWDEPVIARVHRRTQEAVDEQGARLLVELVFHRHASEGNLDEDLQIDGRIAARRNGISVARIRVGSSQAGEDCQFFTSLQASRYSTATI